jgi:hypothetical protein
MGMGTYTTQREIPLGRTDRVPFGSTARASRLLRSRQQRSVQWAATIMPGPHIYTGVGMVIDFYPLFFGGMGVWISRLTTHFWGGMGVWKGEGHPPTPYPYIIFVTYPPFFCPRQLVPIKHWGKVVFLQPGGMGVWNLGFPTPIFRVWGYGTARIQSITIPTPV